MTNVIEPGAMLGILGGGQLGAMFTAAAKRLGYEVSVWDPDPQAPGLKVATRPFPGPFDPSAADAFADGLQAVTFDWENIPRSVSDRLEPRIPLKPSARVLHLLQNRLDQKAFLAAHNVPVPPFKVIESPGQLDRAAAELGFPCLCKTATSGYDGRGQWMLTDPSSTPGVQASLEAYATPSRMENERLWILESFVPFVRELSVLVVRSLNGESRTYPVVENVHHDGILRLSLAPAPLSSDIAIAAQHLAESIIVTLQTTGVFCVELFHLADGRLLVNEVAPRPHNSGHYTLDACSVSQFEQQVRAVCGLPIGEVRQHSPALMINLLGDDLQVVTSRDGLAQLLAIPGARLHLYGKRPTRPRRKMGHITIIGECEDEVALDASRIIPLLEAAGSPGAKLLATMVETVTGKLRESAEG